MAKIQNPQDQYGRDLATVEKVNEIVKERLVPLELSWRNRRIRGTSGGAE